MSGITKIPFSSRIESALAVVGPFAPSQMILARTFDAVLAGNHVLERGRQEHVDVGQQQIVIRDLVAAVESVERAHALHVLDRRIDVDAVLVEVAAGAVADRDDLAAFARQQVRGDRADVAESLHGDGRPLNRHAEVLERFARHDHAAAARGLAASERSAHLDRLAGDDRRDGVAHVHGVRVHHPGHHPLVRVDVGRRHVGVWAERVDDAGGVSTRETLELAGAHLERVADHTTLRTAERQVHDRALPSHPGRERLHLFERHVEIEPDAALRWSARRVVEHPVADEHLDLPVVHHHRNGDGDLLFGMAEHLVEARLEIEQVGRAVEPRHHSLERILFVEEPVFIRSNDSVGWESEVGDHWKKTGRRQPAIGEGVR